MTTENGALPSCVERYLSTAVADRAALIDDVFALDAVVHDEGVTHVGIEAIRKWTTDLAEQFTFDAQLEQTARDGARIRADVTYTGNFPGSPIQVSSYFTVEDDLICEIDNRN